MKHRKVYICRDADFYFLFLVLHCRPYVFPCLTLVMVTSVGIHGWGGWHGWHPPATTNNVEGGGGGGKFSENLAWGLGLDIYCHV